MLHTAIGAIRELLSPYRIMMGFGVLAGGLVLWHNSSSPLGARARAVRLGAFALSLLLGYGVCHVASC